MSGGPSSWAGLAWTEAPGLAILVALAVLPLALWISPRLPARAPAALAGSAAALSTAAFAWGARVTGLHGMAPIWLGGALAGLALGWALGAALSRGGVEPFRSSEAPRSR